MPRIREITTLSVRYPEPNDNNQLRYLTFAKVLTDDGVVGWGEAISQFPAAAKATEALIEGMAEWLIGRDIHENVALWHEMRSKSWWFGYRGGIASFALSAIDIALWDARARTLNLSLVNLLGGARVASLPAVASTHAFDASLEAEAERHGRYTRSGDYMGVKIGMGKAGQARLGYDIDRDVSFLARLRDECGPDAWLMMDRGQSLTWTLDQAIERTRRFEGHGLKWIEEPFEPWQTDEFKVLRGKVDCLIAGGEREWDERGYAEALGPGVLDVVGCDVGRAGGITGALGVIRLVERHHRWFNSHAWSSAVNTAVSIALSASTDRCLVQELKPDPNPMQYELVDDPIVASNGRVAVLTGPGIGVEIKESVLHKYRF
ncbi:mandelate racemase/muconate lactonizing enzyme family protein [Dactylosporangium sp. CA-233914]|uniref:mandelate racemase/muconate lactonizing enzyme family protein n=1 Tax=Dactylosporangium sp. CA-233914 TaxID=3239934 RepID=UPI003D8F1FE7